MTADEAQVEVRNEEVVEVVEEVKEEVQEEEPEPNHLWLLKKCLCSRVVMLNF